MDMAFAAGIHRMECHQKLQFTADSRTEYGTKALFGGFFLRAKPGVPLLWFDHHLIVVGSAG